MVASEDEKQSDWRFRVGCGLLTMVLAQGVLHTTAASHVSIIPLSLIAGVIDYQAGPESARLWWSVVTLEPFRTRRR